MEILYSINIRLSQNVSNDNNEKDSKFLKPLYLGINKHLDVKNDL